VAVHILQKMDSQQAMIPLQKLDLEQAMNQALGRDAQD
jgi:hypothetical protein